MASRLYFVWLHNRTNSCDDYVLKIKATSKQKAKHIAEELYQECRFYIGKVLTGKEFKRHDPYWHSMLWGQPAVNT